MNFKEFLNTEDSLTESFLIELRKDIEEASNGRLLDIDKQCDDIRKKVITQHGGPIMSFVAKSKNLVDKILNFFKKGKLDINIISDMYINNYNFRYKLIKEFNFLKELENHFEIIKKKLHSGDLIHSI